MTGRRAWPNPQRRSDLFVLVAALLVTVGLAGLFFVLAVFADDIRVKAGSAIAALSFAALAVLALGIREVPAGQVGIVTSFGQVREQALQSGLHYVAPLVNNVTILDTRVQVYDYKDIEGASRDLQAVRLTGVVNFRIDPQTAWKLYREVGTDYITKVFTRPAETALKTVTPKFNATEIISKRDEVAKEARALLEPQIVRYGITVEAFYVSNIGLNQAFLDAVEQKQIAEQQVLQQQQLLAKSRVEAQQRVVEAQAQADAQVVRAKAEAEANRIVAASLSDTILLNRYIEKLADNISVMLVPSGQDTLLDLRSLLPKTQ